MTKEESAVMILKYNGDCFPISCDECIFKLCNRRDDNGYSVIESRHTRCLLNLHCEKQTIESYSDLKLSTAVKYLNIMKLELMLDISND